MRDLFFLRLYAFVSFLGPRLNRSKTLKLNFGPLMPGRFGNLVKRLSQDACYGCSHRSSTHSDHKICQLDDLELITHFLEKADALTDLNAIVEERKTSLNQMTPPIEEDELAPFDEQWIMSQFILPNRHEMLSSLMSGDVNHTPNVTLEMGTEGQFIPCVVPSIGEQEWMSILSDLGLEFMSTPEGENSNDMLTEKPEEGSSSYKLAALLDRVESATQPEDMGEFLFPEDGRDEELVAVLDRVESVIQPEDMGEFLYPEDNIQVSKPKLTFTCAVLYKVNCSFYFKKVDQVGGRLDLENAYQLTQTNRREVPRFKTTATDYLLKVNQFDISGLLNVLDALEKIFGRVLSDMTKGMGTDDQLRFFLQSQQLPTPISLPFMPVRELTPQQMMFEVERVLQSHEDFSLDGSVHINLIHVAIPSGGKRRDYCPRFINLEERLKKKNCFVRIQNRDELCCARAIVTAIARIDNNRYYDDIRRGRAIQREWILIFAQQFFKPVRRWCHHYLLKTTVLSFPKTRKTLSLPIYTEENPISVLLNVYEEIGPMNWGRLLMFLSYVNRHNLSMEEWNVVYE